MAQDVSRTAARTSVFPLARLSTVDLIAIELRKAIFAGGLPVGRSLGEVEIAAQLGVSRGPLREAAQRLVQEGLLVANPGRGLSVPEIAGEQVEDLYVARLAVEAQAARQLARTRDAAALARLDGAFDALVAASQGQDAREIGDADLDFHQLLVDEAGNRRLSQYMAALAIQTRIASLSHPDGYSVRRSISPTYRQLLTAISGGDEVAAVQALETQFSDAVARLQGRDDAVDTVETPTDPLPQPFDPIVDTGAD